jgi:hypothetical protein
MSELPRFSSQERESYTPAGQRPPNANGCFVVCAIVSVCLVGGGFTLSLLGNASKGTATPNQPGLTQVDLPEEPAQGGSNGEASAAEALTKFRSKLSAADPKGAIVVRAGLQSGSEYTAVVVVSGQWHHQPKGARKEAAQGFWRLWSQARSPSEPDRARIKIQDQSGNELGGSSWIAGSIVEIKD